MNNINFGSGIEDIKDYNNLDKKDLDLDKFPYNIESNSVDNIRMHEVLEHLEKPYDTIKEFYRILKNKGNIDITVPYMDIGTNPLHKQVFNEDWFLSLDKTKKQHNKFTYKENPNKKIEGFSMDMDVECEVKRSFCPLNVFRFIVDLIFPKNKIIVKIKKTGG